MEKVNYLNIARLYTCVIEVVSKFMQNKLLVNSYKIPL